MKATTYFEAHTRASRRQASLVRYRIGGNRDIDVALDAMAQEWQRLERQRAKFAARVEAALRQRDALLEANARMLPILDGLYDGEGARNWDGLAIAMRELRAAIAKGRPA